MIIYIEKKALGYDLSNLILEKFNDSTVIEISNYKNIFDKNAPKINEKILILANLDSIGIAPVPENYSDCKKSFFFKTSLNCPYDCSYCYLKGAFKNDFQVIFVNYEDIMKSITEKINGIRETGYSDKILFYASDYSDTLALENITMFHENFIPFFEKFDNVIMESRTKSANISRLLDLGFVPKNTEIAFSLSPQSVISSYERLTPSLDDRIIAINKLLKKGFKVGLRFLPLLPVEDFNLLYSDFLDKIVKEIDLDKVYSISAGSLLYTKEDYAKILKKESSVDVLYRLGESDNEFIRAPTQFRDEIYSIFREKLSKFSICLDN